MTEITKTKSATAPPWDDPVAHLRSPILDLSAVHEGIKAAVSKVLTAGRQRCRVHFMRNALAHAGKSGRRVVSAFIATAFAQDDAEAARLQWRKVADQLRRRGLRGVRLVVSDAHEGIKAAVSKVLTASWQRCQHRAEQSVQNWSSWLER